MEQSEISCMLWRGMFEGLYIRSLEKFGKDVSVRGRGSLRYHLRCCLRCICGFGKDDVRFDSIQSFLLYLVHDIEYYHL